MSIDNYQIIRSIGKGGMGEVLLVFDPETERQIALKRIRTDLKNRDAFRNRFLREAKITASLTHPGIISIYSICQNGELYYTMPFVEGKTLKTILRQKNGPAIPQLLPIFKNICQTIAYAHSKDIIHRDVKPENILVGNFGEVIILDWGLAVTLHEHHEEIVDIKDIKEIPELTHPGKIVGTLAYMAPERALANPANEQSDIYALGVILYQILTLHLPFERSTLKEFRKNHAQEKLIDPEEMAPYRDVPLGLSRIAKKALAANPEERYQSTDELVHDLLNHMEGKSGWFEVAQLDVNKKSDWEFQENVLIAKHIAVTPTHTAAEWVSLMISKASFAENIHLETTCRIDSAGSGIAILFCVPEEAEREHPLSGYTLWLGTESAQLLRNTVVVCHLDELYLTRLETHTLSIEKIDNHIHFSLDGVKKFSYVSHLPLTGTRIGILSRDDAYELGKITVSVGSQNLQVSCLSIPDAFLANKDYKRSLAEYRRIWTSFPGHAEGREALFRAGITLVEQAKGEKNQKKREKLFATALEEFGQLHNTPGAPLEYLGKALVYEAMKETKEEINCLELGLRRYPKHPQIGAIKEQILYRMHESTSYDRPAAYRLILIVLRGMPVVARSEDALRLFRGVLAHAEPLPFEDVPLDPTQFGKEENENEKKEAQLHFAALLAFWLALPYFLLEIFEEASDPALKSNILYFLIELGSYELAEKLNADPLLTPLIQCHSQGLEKAVLALKEIKTEDIGTKEFRSWCYLMEYALSHDQEVIVEEIASHLLKFNLSREDRIHLDAYRIWADLATGNIEEAGWIFETYSPELLNQESTILHPLYGCYLFATEGEEIAKIHFAGVIDTPFPRSWALLGHQLTNRILQNPTWVNGSFLWERRMLYKQLALYYKVTQNKELEAYYRHLEREEIV